MGLFGKLRIFGQREQNPRKVIQEILDGYELPSFSGLVVSVLSRLRDPDSSMVEISEILQADPGMHVKVLQTVNSAAFALANKVSNIHRAVTLLGRSRLETILLTHAVRDSLPDVREAGFDSRQFWLSSARRAFLARGLASRLHPGTEAESFTAGLLQDMAIPVLVDSRRDQYVPLLARWNEGTSPGLNTLEQEALGFDHSTVGGLMARDWRLPDTLIQAIEGHHADDGGPVDPAVQIVSLIRYGEEQLELEDILSMCQDRFGLERDLLTTLIDTAYEDARSFSRLL